MERRALLLGLLTGCTGVVAGDGAPRGERVDAGAGAGEIDASVDPGPLTCESKSGARLRIVRMVAEDGTTAFAGMFDSMIGAPCGFAVADDGVPRCLPAEVPPGTAAETYVAGAQTWLGTSAQISRVDAADGAVVCHSSRPLTLFGGETLQTLGAEAGEGLCLVARADDGELRCTPAWSAERGFADASCTLPTLFVDAGLPMAAVQLPACGGRQARAIGPAVAPIYERTAGTCEPIVDVDALRSVGEPLPATVAPIVERVFVASGTRLQRGVLTVEGDVRFASPLLRDPELDATCVFRALADGVPRCYPLDRDRIARPRRSFGSGSGTFSDPGCTAVADVARLPDGACDRRPALISDFALDAVAGSFWEVGDVHVGPLYEGAPGTCRAVDDAFVYYTAGAPIPAERFVRATAELE